MKGLDPKALQALLEDVNRDIYNLNWNDREGVEKGDVTNVLERLVQLIAILLEGGAP